jgi:hypothetical protein
MDSLHGVLRSIHKPQRRDHLAVFREFLNHLDRVARRGASRDVKARQGGKPKRRGKG